MVQSCARLWSLEQRALAKEQCIACCRQRHGLEIRRLAHLRHGWSARDRNTGYCTEAILMLRFSLCATLLFAAGTAMADSSVQYRYGEATATDNVSATSTSTAGTATASDCSCTTGGCASCNDCS